MNTEKVPVLPGAVVDANDNGVVNSFPKQSPLRTAESLICLSALLVLALLWVQSYRGETRISGHFSNTRGVRLYSSRGCLIGCTSGANGAAQNYAWRIEPAADFWIDTTDDRHVAVPSFDFQDPGYMYVSMPY